MIRVKRSTALVQSFIVMIFFIMAAAYKAVGLPVPWHYRAPRDTRTLFDVAGITDHSAWMADRPGPLGVPHHSLDDSICQARAVCDAWEMLRA